MHAGQARLLGLVGILGGGFLGLCLGGLLGSRFLCRCFLGSLFLDGFLGGLRGQGDLDQVFSDEDFHFFLTVDWLLVASLTA